MFFAATEKPYSPVARVIRSTAAPTNIQKLLYVPQFILRDIMFFIPA